MSKALKIILILLMVGVSIGVVAVIVVSSDTSPKNIKVTFDSNGGSEVTAMNLREGEAIYSEQLLKIYSLKDWYVFDGWYSDKGLTKKYDSDYIKKSTTFYAKWLPMFELMYNGEYQLSNGYIKGYEEFAIPETYKSAPVTRIKAEAFIQSDLTSVFIPSSFKWIGNGAFFDAKLQSVEFDEACFFEYLGEDAFSNTKITELVIPSAKNAAAVFKNCPNLRSVRFCDNAVFPLTDQTFSGCAAIEEIYIPDTMADYSAGFKNTAWYKSQPNGMIYLGNFAHRYKGNMPENAKITLQSGTLAVAAGCFADQVNLTEMTFADSVVYIGDFAFWDCVGLSSLTLPQNLQHLGNSALPYEVNKNMQTLPAMLTHIGGSNFSQSIIETLPAGIKFVGNSAFKNCANIKALPDGLEYLGAGAFEGCTALNSVPRGIAFVGNDAFKDTAWYNAQPDGVVYYETTAISCKGTVGGKVTIKEGITELSEALFGGSKELTEIVLPSSLKTIGDYAFKDCINLGSLKLPYGITSIGIAAFQGCGITTLTIPDTITEIAMLTFYGCENLETVRLPKALVCIGEAAFALTRVKTVSIPATTAFVEIGAFKDSALTTVYLDMAAKPCTWSEFETIWAADVVVHYKKD